MARRLAKYLIGTVLFLGVWVALLAGLAFTAEPGSNVAAFTLPGRAAEVAVEAGGSLEEFSSMLVITRSTDQDFVSHLYASGTFLVIDARVIAGCRAAYTRARQGLGL
jgi:hypothetical protein